MRKLTAFISKGTKECSAWIEELPGVYGSGATIEEARTSLSKALELHKQRNPALSWLTDGIYQIEYNIQ